MGGSVKTKLLSKTAYKFNGSISNIKVYSIKQQDISIYTMLVYAR